MSEKRKKLTKIEIVICVISVLAVILSGTFMTVQLVQNGVAGKKTTARTEKTGSAESEKTQKFMAEFPYDLQNNAVSNFDIAFLKAENEAKNKIYSPLSIKYTLKMLEEGAGGNTKRQISDVLGDYKVTKYTSGANMSLANALFVRDTFKDTLEESYLSRLQIGYNADVICDPFTSPDRVNSWVKEKTLGLIPQLKDDMDPSLNFLLVNALGIDMEWKYKFFDFYDNMFTDEAIYSHVKYFAGCNKTEIVSEVFDGKTDVAGMSIFASLDNYNIVQTLGEDNIRKTVGDAYRKWIGENKKNAWGEPLTDAAAIEKEIKEYLDRYIDELKADYVRNKEAKSTDFSVYTDENVRVFAKDLKTYGGTTLQYVAVMPEKETLDAYVARVDSAALNRIVDNLKELKAQNFKDGVITSISGYIPKFSFEYTLKLKEDLAKIGVTDVFDSGKADISGITGQKGQYIGEAVHKANIELTQDGIKAAAATFAGGKGAGDPEFDYLYDVPVEEIDLTFKKPYLFLIRDKDTGDVWFTGTVYEPLEYEKDETRFGQ